MKESNKFNTPVSVKIIAYLFLLSSPAILYLILFKYNFQLDYSVATKGVLKDNEIICRKEKNVDYRNIESITISDRNYSMHHYKISDDKVFIYLNTKEKRYQSNTLLMLKIKEEKTLIELLFK